MKGRNDCGFAGGLDATARETRARGIGFMLLVHKFPMNGARMNRRPPFRALTYPVSSRFFSLLPPTPTPRVLCRCFPFFHLPSCVATAGPYVLGLSWWPVDPDPPLCEISARLFTAVSLGARVTREEISEFIDSRPASSGRLCCAVD
jgi:hypothetical protein